MSWAFPLVADGTPAAPVAPAAPADDFGQYLADHQDTLAPFFVKNAGDLFKLAVPLAMGMTGGIIFFTMLVGWGLDVLLSRGFAFFFAPVYAEWKRAIIYATGRLFLSFLYTCLIGLGIVFSLGLAYAGVIILSVIALLMLVALAAQVVWILYLYRTTFMVSALFYIVVIVVHTAAGFLLAGPLLGSRAPGSVTNFIDAAITPKLRAEVDSTKGEVEKAKGERNSLLSKTNDLKAQIDQAQRAKEDLKQEIEAKKNSDIYVLAQIVKLRANGDLKSAQDQLSAFPAKFPSSPLNGLVQSQLSELNSQIATQAVQQKQEEADAARAAAQARADLLSRAARGEVTLSEMRQALISKSRAQVKDLLGPPSSTGPDSWGYGQQMIVNPITNEKSGLTVYFNEGLVQSVDYNRSGGSL